MAVMTVLLGGDLSRLKSTATNEDRVDVIIDHASLTKDIIQIGQQLWNATGFV